MTSSGGCCLKIILLTEFSFEACVAANGPILTNRCEALLRFLGVFIFICLFGLRLLGNGDM